MTITCYHVTHLASTTDAYAIEQSKELVRFSCSDDVTGSWAVVRVLLPAPHHQLPQQHRTLQILEGGREGGRRLKTFPGKCIGSPSL